MTFSVRPYRIYAVPIDPYASYVRSLLHFDASGTTITDVYSLNLWTAYGTATQSSSSPIYGSGSYYSASGTDGDNVRTKTAPANFNFGTGDFTVEFSIKAPAQTASFPTAIELYNNSGGGAYADANIIWQLYFNPASGDASRWYCGAAGDIVTGSASTIFNDATHYVAYSRVSGVGYLYVDGVRVGTAADTQNYTGGTVLSVGSTNGSSDTVKGKLDEVRITNGVGRYSGSTYTVQTTAFPDIGVGKGETAWMSPTTAVPADASGAPDWSNLTNILSSDNSYATVTVDGASPTIYWSDYVYAQNFGFSIPTGNVITGLDIKYEGYASTADGKMWGFMVQGAGSSYSWNVSPMPTTEGTITVSSNVDGISNNNTKAGAQYMVMGQTALTQAMVNDSTFGIGFQYRPGSLSTLTLDNVQMKVYYALPTSPMARYAVDTTTSSSGTVNWTFASGDSYFAPDGGFATQAVSTTTANNKGLHNFAYGFDIPSTATIDGIEVAYTWKKDSSPNITPVTVQLAKDNGSGSWATAGSNLGDATALPTTVGTRTFGGPTNLWGTTWTPAEIKAANFGPYVQFARSGGTGNAYVDAAQVKVYWHIDVPTSPTSLRYATNYGPHGGSASWTNPNYGMAAPNGLFATQTPTTVTADNNGLALYEYLSNVPSDAIIDGIELIYTWKRDSAATITPDIIRVIREDAGGGTYNASLGSNLGNATALPTTLSTTTFGGPTELWGYTWTAAQINSKWFGSYMQFGRTGSSGVVSVDSCQIKVYWHQ